MDEILDIDRVWSCRTGQIASLERYCLRILRRERASREGRSTTAALRVVFSFFLSFRFSRGAYATSTEGGMS